MRSGVPDERLRPGDRRQLHELRPVLGERLLALDPPGQRRAEGVVDAVHGGGGGDLPQPLLALAERGVRVEEGTAGGAALLLLGIARRIHPGPVRGVPFLLELIAAETVENPLGVLLLDRVVHLVEVPDLEVTALDVTEVRHQVVVDLLLVAVAGGAGEGLLRLDPPQEEVAARFVGEYVGAGRGRVVQLLGLLLGVVQPGEAPAAYSGALVALAALGLEVEVPGAVSLAELRACQPDVPDLRLAVRVEDRVALLVLERFLALAPPVVARLEHPTPCWSVAWLTASRRRAYVSVRVWRDLFRSWWGCRTPL